MEFTKAQIAALVLGYLKSEKLSTVINEFLNCSPYLNGKSRGIRNGKYFVTRVAELRLVDILEQYALVYTVVQGRLEETDFYDIHTPNGTTLVQKLLFLLDKELPSSKALTPERSTNSEVEATSSEELPGNAPNEDDAYPEKTPKRKTSKCEAYDVSDILSSFLESHELHEKIAENINIVRNTPEVVRKLPDEPVTAGASKERDAVVKTALQKTEEDPVYNKLLDEIVGTIPTESTSPKKPLLSIDEPMEASSSSSNHDDASKTNNVNETIDALNNDAIRSIIEASQQTAPPQDPPIDTPKDQNGEVYVFDGTLDSYLKSTVATSVVNPNPLYINPGGVIVMPPPDKQYYIVNNQPLINLNVKTPILTEKEIMSIPTVIVNEPPTAVQTSLLAIKSTNTKKVNQRNRVIRAKTITTTSATAAVTTTTSATAAGTATPTTTAGGSCLLGTPKLSKKVPTTDAPTAGASLPQLTPTTAAQPAAMVTRQASHVRNLNFTTPSAKAPPKKDKKAWDEDLRMLVCGSREKSPSPKRKRPASTKKKKKKVVKSNSEDCEEEKENQSVEYEKENPSAEEKEKVASQTPVKDIIPKTPGGGLITGNSSFHCTSFNDVLEEQLKGVDLCAIPTPSIPITPGFALTPGDLVGYNQRSTDYSTSSSYYQPSDTEQNRSIDQLIEECKRLDGDRPSPPPDKFKDLKILSDVVIKHARKGGDDDDDDDDDDANKPTSAVIGKKNLNLVNHELTTSSSSSDSESESEAVQESVDNTAICKPANETTANGISDIINKVEVGGSTLELDKETKRKDLLTHLEEVRRRTIQKIKNPDASKKLHNRKEKPAKVVSRKSSKIKELSPVARKNPRKGEKVKNSANETRQSAKKKDASVNKGVTTRSKKGAETGEEVKKNTKKKASEESSDEKSKKLVTDLAQRGIHLVPNNHNGVKEKTTPPPPPPPHVDEGFSAFERRTFENIEIAEHRSATRGRELCSYNFDLLKKSASITVFDEDLNKEVTSILKWTKFESILELKATSPQKVKKGEQEMEDELMDYVVSGSLTEASRCGRKRKSKCSEDEDKLSEKKNKSYENNIKLLKKIDVDSFLDKVHGE